jgi:hypothetical protein
MICCLINLSVFTGFFANNNRYSANFILNFSSLNRLTHHQVVLMGKNFREFHIHKMSKPEGAEAYVGHLNGSFNSKKGKVYIIKRYFI